MKSAREAGHDAATLVGVCADHYQGTHTKSCDRITAEVDARDREHAEEVERLRAERKSPRCFNCGLPEGDEIHRDNGDDDDDAWHDFREHGQVVAELAGEIIDLRASLATVTADRDAARSDLAEARVSIGKLRSCVTSRENDTYAAFHEGDAWQARAEKAEAALAASVRREDVFGLLAEIRAKGWSVAVHNDYRQSGQQYTFWLFTKEGRAVKGEGEDDCAALAKVRLGIEPVVLRDLATMDGRPAEVPTEHLRPCPQHPEEIAAGWGHMTCDCAEAREKMRQRRAARPTNKETDNG